MQNYIRYVAHELTVAVPNYRTVFEDDALLGSILYKFNLGNELERSNIFLFRYNNFTCQEIMIL